LLSLPTTSATTIQAIQNCGIEVAAAIIEAEQREEEAYQNGAEAAQCPLRRFAAP